MSLNNNISNPDKTLSPLPDLDDSTTQQQVSPKWGWSVKLVVSVLLIVGAIALAIKFLNYVNLFLTAFVLSVLIQPIVRFIARHTKANWKLVSALVYLVVLSLLIWGIFSGASRLVGEVTGLINSLQKNVSEFTKFLADWSNKTVELGPFDFKLPNLNTRFISEKITENVQPLIGGVAKNIPGMLKNTGNFLFNLVSTILMSFFITSESGGNKKPLFDIKNQDYSYDIRRMGHEISGNFNAFLRGTMVVVMIAIVVYTALLGMFGVPYYFLLAVIAGFGRFIPYVGAFIGWVGFAIGALMQPNTPFGLTPFVYMLVLLGIALFIDLILDHIITPTVMSQALDVHPVAIMISALIGAQLFGLLGVILAAPSYAVLILMLRYAVRKLFDEDPWEGIVYYRKPREPGIIKGLRKLIARLAKWTEKPRHAIRDWFRKVWAGWGVFFKKLVSKLPKRKRKAKAGSEDGTPSQPTERVAMDSAEPDKSLEESGEEKI